MKDIMTMILTIVTLIASTKALNDLARVLRELNKTIEVTQINPLAFVSSVVLFFYKKRSSLSTRSLTYYWMLTRGFEPPTSSLLVTCSANWAKSACVHTTLVIIEDWYWDCKRILKKVFLQKSFYFIAILIISWYSNVNHYRRNQSWNIYNTLAWILHLAHLPPAENEWFSVSKIFQSSLDALNHFICSD